MDMNTRREIQNMRMRSGRMTRDYTDHISGVSPGIYRNYLSPDIFQSDSERTDPDSRICIGQLYGGRGFSLYRWTGQIKEGTRKINIHGLK